MPLLDDYLLTYLAHNIIRGLIRTRTYIFSNIKYGVFGIFLDLLYRGQLTLLLHLRRVGQIVALLGVVTQSHGTRRLS